MAKTIDDEKRCKFVRPDGTRCNGFKIKDSDFCYSHSNKDTRMKRNIKYRTLMMEKMINSDKK